MVLSSCYSNNHTVIDHLKSDPEEDDTRMLLRVGDASSHSRIIDRSSDTDLCLFCVSLFKYMIGCSELRFRTGVKDKFRYIPCHMIARKIGIDLYEGLLDFHVILGCDYTSAQCGIGKKKSFKQNLTPLRIERYAGRSTLLKSPIKPFLCSRLHKFPYLSR